MGLNLPSLAHGRRSHRHSVSTRIRKASLISLVVALAAVSVGLGPAAFFSAGAGARLLSSQHIFTESGSRRVVTRRVLNKDSSVVEAAPFVGFGKYAELSYTELLRWEPNFCQWVLNQTSADENTAPAMHHLQQWLREQSIPTQRDVGGVIKQGKYRSTSFDSLLKVDPVYAKWICEKADDPKTNDNFRSFAWWAKGQAALSDDERIPFGKHKGRSFAYVAEKFPGYCKWLLDSNSANEKPDSPLSKFVTWLGGERASA